MTRIDFFLLLSSSVKKKKKKKKKKGVWCEPDVFHMGTVTGSPPLSPLSSLLSPLFSLLSPPLSPLPSPLLYCGCVVCFLSPFPPILFFFFIFFLFFFLSFSFSCFPTSHTHKKKNKSYMLSCVVVCPVKKKKNYAKQLFYSKK